MSNLLVFLVAALVPIKVQLIGTLGIGELIILSIIPFLALRRIDTLTSSGVPLLLTLGVGWLLSQIVSDFWHRTAPTEFLRGWANIIMILASLIFYLTTMGGNVRSILFFLIGRALGEAIAIFGFGMSSMDLDNEVEWWDTHVSPTAGPLVLAVACILWVRHPWMSAVILLVFGIISATFDARAQGLVFALAGGLCFFIAWSSLRQLDWRHRAITPIAIGGAVTVAVAFIAYTTLGLAGLLGEKTEGQLHALKSPYNPLHAVLVARPEIYVSADAISDSPILGHGSWAYDAKYEVGVAEGISSITGLYVPPPRRRPGEVPFIPVHSTLFAAWVFGGVLGAVFWLGVSYFIAKLGLFYFLRPWFPMFPVIAYLVIAGAWHILFSPMTWARWEWPALMAFALVWQPVLSGSHSLMHPAPAQ